MFITKPAVDEMVRSAWKSVSQNTGLTNDSESGFAYNIIRVFMAELSNLWDALESAQAQSTLSLANGSNLDIIGDFFGVRRKTARVSSTLGSAASISVTNNNLSTITLPGNTRVWPSSDNTISYFTIGDVTVNAGLIGYVDVVAAQPGNYFNVGAGKLDSQGSGVANLVITNELPITSGADIESDDNYRVRIQNEILSRESSNVVAVREALLGVPGIRDVQINNLARGTGTLDAVLYGYDRIIPQDVINECQLVLDLTVAAGISAIAKAPVVKFVDVTVTVKVKDGAVLSDIKSIISTVVRGYLDNLPIEDGSGKGSLIYQELAARVQQSSNLIINTDTRLNINDVPSLKADQLAAVGERFVSRSVLIS